MCVCFFRGGWDGMEWGWGRGRGGVQLFVLFFLGFFFLKET